MSYYGAAEPLTREQFREMLERAVERIKNTPPEVCGITKPHLLHPRGSVCIECGWVRPS